MPGVDGFGAEFYLKIAEQVAPLLLRMLSQSIQSKTQAPILYNADTTLLLKPERGHDPSIISSNFYSQPRFQIFTKILVRRQNQCIASLIHTDQTGFSPNRCYFFRYQKSNKYYALQISFRVKASHIMLNGENTFDQVE